MKHPDAAHAKRIGRHISDGLRDLLQVIEGLRSDELTPRISNLIRTAPRETHELLGCLIAGRAAAGRQGEVAILHGELSRTLFRLSLTEGGPVRVLFAHLELELPGLGPSWSSNAVEWLYALSIASLLRDEDLRAFLLQVPIDVLERSQEAPYEPPLRAARALMSGTVPQTIAGILDAAKLCESIPPGDVGDMATELWAPAYRTWAASLEMNQADYEVALGKAIAKHGAYYTATEERRRMPVGFFSLVLTGIASEAHDAGLSLGGVRSPYLPEYIVQGAFRGMAASHGSPGS